MQMALRWPLLGLGVVLTAGFSLQARQQALLGPAAFPQPLEDIVNSIQGDNPGRRRTVIVVPTISVVAYYSSNVASLRSTLAFFNLATLGRPFSNGGKSSPWISGDR